MIDKAFPVGLIQTIDTDDLEFRHNVTIYSLFQDYLKALKVPFYDTCCLNFNTPHGPVGYDSVIEKFLFYNPETKLWEVIPIVPSNISFTSYEIEEEVDTINGTALGLTNGTFVFAHPDLAGKNVLVHRNLQKIPNKPWSSNTYYTKNLLDNFLTFNDALQSGELVSILIL